MKRPFWFLGTVSLLVTHCVCSFAEVPHDPVPLTSTSANPIFCLKYFEKGRLKGWDWRLRSSDAQVLLSEHNAKGTGETIEFSMCGPDLVPEKARLSESGYWGLAVSQGSKMCRVLPADLMQSNLTFDQALRRKRFNAPGSRYLRFTTQSYLIHDGQRWPLTRTGTLVAPLSQADFHTFSQNLKSYQLHQLGLFGNQLPYQYDPVKGLVRSEQLLLARMGLGAWSLANLARVSEMPLFELTSHLQVFQTQYLRQSPYGVCFGYNNDRALGGLALGGLAYLRHYELLAKEQRKGHLFPQLGETLLKMQAENGMLVCQAQAAPPGKDPMKDTNQSFYPGEALLFAAEAYQVTHDVRYRQLFEKSWPFYIDYFGRKHNLPCIPWLAQAGTSMWKQTKDPKLVKDIFMLQDWLLDHQPTAKNPPPDSLGAIGGPVSHASSSGVFMEGMVDAFELANLTGDQKRAQRYQKAIQGAFRYLCQLQYRDLSCMYWIPEERRPWVAGGLHNFPWDPVIQIDNQSHTLNAVLKVEALQKRGLEIFPKSVEPAPKAPVKAPSP